MDESQTPVTKEMFYLAQKAMADNVKNISKEVTQQNDVIKEHFGNVDTFMKETKELLEVVRDTQTFFKTGGWVAKGVILIGAACTAIWGFVKFIKYLTLK